MESIPKFLPNSIQRKLQQLQQRLELSNPLCFYGSALRGDFVPNKSDLDIAIFTDNASDTIVKLQSFFGAVSVKHVVWKLNQHLIHGHKINTVLRGNDHQQYDCELSIYGTQYKSIVVADYRKGLDVPLIPFVMLCVVKWLHYIVPVLSPPMYAHCKRFILDSLVIHGKQSTFVSY